ncbi:MAG: hypothetical protein WD069_01430 [Planctomycetales bacterium]
MRNLLRGAAALALVGLGYGLGASGVLAPDPAHAQAVPGAAQPAAGAFPGLSDEARAKVQAANDALRSAIAALEQEKQYVPVVNTVNAFAASVGGMNVLADLEAGRGVDPETFAALYAGLATDEVAKDLGKDEEDRVTYKGKVVRMYPISRLKALFGAREQIGQKE